jgi:hypothetical protein
MAVEGGLDWTLKTIYPDGRPEFLGWQETPMLAMVKKRPDFGGREWKWAAYHGQPQNRSADALTAFTGNTQQVGKEFVINRVQNYGSFKIQRETILASQKVGSDSYIDDLKAGIDGTMNQFMLDMYYDLFLDGSGVRGQISAISTTAIANDTITLKDISRAIYYEEGQAYVFSADGGGDVAGTPLRGSSATNGLATAATAADLAIVKSVNYLTGVIVFDRDLTTITGVVANDYLYMNGDRGRKPTGLLGWCPKADPTAGDSFFGVDRSSNPVRLAGIRADKIGGSISEKILHMIKVASIQGVNFPIVIMHPDNVETLTLELGAKQHLPVVDVPSYEMANVYFKGIQIHGHGRSVVVVSDRACQVDRAWGLNPAELEIDSLGGCPEIIRMNNGQFFQETDDSFRVRVGGYLQYRCPTPKRIVTADLSV